MSGTLNAESDIYYYTIINSLIGFNHCSIMADDVLRYVIKCFFIGQRTVLGLFCHASHPAEQLKFVSH